LDTPSSYKRYFGITELLDEKSAPSIWEQANAALASGLTAHAILQKFRVEAVCTTDDPVRRSRPSSRDREVQSTNASLSPRSVPTKALAIGDAEFPRWGRYTSRRLPTLT